MSMHEKDNIITETYNQSRAAYPSDSITFATAYSADTFNSQSSSSSTLSYETPNCNSLHFEKDIEFQSDNMAISKQKKEKRKSRNYSDNFDLEEEIDRKSKKSRGERSLLELTKSFKDILHSSPDGVVELNEAADKLSVEKRRIYDITNVLEGIDLIKKSGKNKVQWNTETPDHIASNDTNLENESILKEIDDLKSFEEDLDRSIRMIEEKVQNLINDETFKKFAYITHEDIRNLPSCVGQTIFVISAPKGTHLEVPDPDSAGDGSKIYEIFLNNSEFKPIDVYVLSDENNDINDGAEYNNGTEFDENYDEPMDSYTFLDMFS